MNEKTKTKPVTKEEENEREEIDEQARKEIEEANRADAEAAAAAATKAAALDNAAATAVVVAPEVESEEIAGLRAAFQKVEEKIEWHRTQIGNSQKDIEMHERQIEDLRALVRNKFSNLTGVQQSQPKRSPGRPKGSGSGNGSAPKKQGPKTRTSYGDGNSTGDLIAACLKKARKPVDTKHITDYLSENGNNTNPSVELSRMVTKGIVSRPTRGLYEWTGE